MKQTLQPQTLPRNRHLLIGLSFAAVAVGLVLAVLEKKKAQNLPEANESA